MLTRKVDTLNKAMEVEGKKSLREKTAMVKEMEAIRSEKDKELKARRLKGGAGSFRNREVHISLIHTRLKINIISTSAVVIN